jgi:hypothetical protein
MMGGGDGEREQLDDQVELARFLQEFESAQREHDVVNPQQSRPLHPAIYVGVGSLFIVNLAMLLSLPPVLLGKGGY